MEIRSGMLIVKYRYNGAEIQQLGGPKIYYSITHRVLHRNRGDCEGESLLGGLLVDISLHGVGADSHNVGLEVGKSRESLGESDDLVLYLVRITESSSCDGMAL